MIAYLIDTPLKLPINRWANIHLPSTAWRTNRLTESSRIGKSGCSHMTGEIRDRGF
jgi:hypothetical protein